MTPGRGTIVFQVAIRPMKRAMMLASPGRVPAVSFPSDSTRTITGSFDANAVTAVTSRVVPSVSWAVTTSGSDSPGARERGSGAIVMWESFGAPGGSRGTPAAIHARSVTTSSPSGSSRRPPP